MNYNKNFWKFVEDIIKITGSKLKPCEFYYNNKTIVKDIYRKKIYLDASRPSAPAGPCGPGGPAGPSGPA
jgi:hypothetical protein